MMPMAGYAARTQPAEGVAQDLYAKALALEDTAGTRVVMITTDLVGITRGVREHVEQAVNEQFKLPPSGLLLNASHTHCGPEYRPRAAQLYGDDAPETQQARAYTKWLQEELVKL